MVERIESIELRNFQSHERTRIHLDPQVTTIVGPSDLGKTALLRGLWWLCFNRPSGLGFLKRGSKSSRVTLCVGGRRIIRKRSSRENLYGMMQHTFKAMGVEVPTPIASFLKLESINFQRQLDQHFWFSETPGEVGRKLNEIVDLQLIDAVLKEAAAESRRCKSSVEESYSRLQQARKERKSLDWTVRADRKLSRIESLGEEAASLSRQEGILEEQISRITDSRKFLKSGRKRLGKLLEILSAADRLKSVELESARLQELVSRITKVEADRKRAIEKSKTTEARVKREMKGRCPICGGKL